MAANHGSTVAPASNCTWGGGSLWRMTAKILACFPRADVNRQTTNDIRPYVA